MKKAIGFIVLATVFLSCEDVRINESKIDSAGATIQRKVERAADTVVSKVDQWTDSLDNDRVDTLHR